LVSLNINIFSLLEKTCGETWKLELTNPTANLHCQGGSCQVARTEAGATTSGARRQSKQDLCSRLWPKCPPPPSVFFIFSALQPPPPAGRPLSNGKQRTGKTQVDAELEMSSEMLEKITILKKSHAS
jgi:hypothetical protein